MQKIRDVHIGKCIKKRLKERNISISDFSGLLHTDKSNVYRLFQKKDINTEMLIRISNLLNYNFFAEFIDINEMTNIQEKKIYIAVEIEQKSLNKLYDKGKILQDLF
jgi:predicted transcriptional regulator